MLIHIIALIGGLVLLVKGADYLVDGASSIAYRFGLSTLLVGLTVVAFGTSAPELAVNMIAAFSGNVDVALGNINGSNIANILLILGVTAMVARIPVRSRTVAKEIPFMILAAVMMVVMMADKFLDFGASELVISRTDGLAMLGFFGIFMYYLYLGAKAAKGGDKEEEPEHSLLISLGLTGAGLFGLALGGHLTVTGATGLADLLGISEGLIAITIVAIGTSLPELVTAIIAARKGKPDLAVGGVVGSNIFNVLLVIGLTSTISPEGLPATQANLEDALVAMGAMVLLLIFLYFSPAKSKKESGGLDKYAGGVFLAIYVIYIAYIVIRG
jgi:cation:H+ antiporter